MQSNRLLTEEVKIECAITPQDIGTAAVTSSNFFSFDNFRKAVIVANVELSAGETMTVTPVASDDESGSTTEELSDYAITITDSDDGCGYIELDVHDMPDDKQYLGVKLDGSAGGDNGSAMILRADSRYSPVEQTAVN